MQTTLLYGTSLIERTQNPTCQAMSKIRNLEQNGKHPTNLLKVSMINTN